jgi:hypothetical protein
VQLCEKLRNVSTSRARVEINVEGISGRIEVRVGGVLGRQPRGGHVFCKSDLMPTLAKPQPDVWVETLRPSFRR